MVEFWTREGVLTHIRYRSNVCRQNLLIHGTIIDEVESDSLDKSELISNISSFSAQF